MNLFSERDAKKPGHYAARQPILTADEKVFGYELLFRDGINNYFSSSDPDAATHSILDTSTLLGLDLLCDSRCAFINCTREVLLGDYITLLPPGRVIAEILETVPPDDQVRAACQSLKAAGYGIALDDFTVNDPRSSLAHLADVIKVDLRQTSVAEGAKLVERYRSRSCRLLAEKVETREEFTAAKNAGFQYFQGYFFRKPELMQAREIPASRATYLQLLQAVSRPELDSRELEDIVKKQVSLCYRLLRYLNSAPFGLANEIRSVGHALTLLGEREVRRWLRLAAMLGAAQTKSSDLVLSALVRARFSELLGTKVSLDGVDLFLLGMLSLMDAILDVPMYIVVEGIPLDHETKAVLLGNDSRLSPVYKLLLAHEDAQWQTVARLSSQLNLTEDFVAEAHWSAMRWARQVTSVA